MPTILNRAVNKNNIPCLLWKNIVFNVCCKRGAGLSTAKMERFPHKAGWPMKRVETERRFLHFHLFLLSTIWIPGSVCSGIERIHLLILYVSELYITQQSCGEVTNNELCILGEKILPRVSPGLELWSCSLVDKRWRHDTGSGSDHGL